MFFYKIFKCKKTNPNQTGTAGKAASFVIILLFLITMLFAMLQQYNISFSLETPQDLAIKFQLEKVETSASQSEITNTACSNDGTATPSPEDSANNKE